MSFGGQGVIDSQELTYSAPHPVLPEILFSARRFQVGGNLPVSQGTTIKKVPDVTCCLCGGLISKKQLKNGEANDEHPLPQWLHTFADDAAEIRSWSFGHTLGSPTWSQLRLRSHKYCNTQFDVKIERPAQSALKAIVDGSRDVTSAEIDRVFDWLDKLKSAAAHMGSALKGQQLVLGYDDVSFPNYRTGAFDRFALFFRLKDSNSRLELWNVLHEGFLTSPAAICLQIKDLLIVYVSSNFLLSQAFGLGSLIWSCQQQLYIPGDSVFGNGFESRMPRISKAKIIAQPMRTFHQGEGILDINRSLRASGEGKIFELKQGRWERFRRSNFNNIPHILESVGRALAGLEAIEWIITAKERDASYYPNLVTGIFMESIDDMRREKSEMLNLLFRLRQKMLVPKSYSFPHRIGY